MATENDTTPNLAALKVLINEINNNAEIVRRLCIEAINIGSDDREQMASCIVGARELAGLIGWKSEKANEILNGAPELVGNADFWLLPPSYHSAVETAEVSREH